MDSRFQIPDSRKAPASRAWNLESGIWNLGLQPPREKAILIFLCEATGPDRPRAGWYFQRRTAATAASEIPSGRPCSTATCVTRPVSLIEASRTTVPSTPARRAPSGYSGSTLDESTAGSSGSSSAGASPSQLDGELSAGGPGGGGSGGVGERFVTVTSLIVLPASGTLAGRLGSGGTRSTSVEWTNATAPSSARTA